MIVIDFEQARRRAQARKRIETERERERREGSEALRWWAQTMLAEIRRLREAEERRE